ncbi:hypothetical protein WJ41_34485 [Burkholderia ubonensis]|uniref:Uncharacterized protein n=1 Tax=Burkholderia ubonensis TaxID=101571 RepID=A0ABD4E7D7_9BURK|nr:hypothetical protein WJ41_34485 [Burkholderia ubonensis]KVN88873.1 hypothetical protein WJ68_04960 [Burkholderia ubonensis]KWO78709.1 hypothetical protein WM32_31170 [Burkholderia ubonensis]OJB18334.1 hypothetical protein BGV54_20605 [Burkholderia ubonensis]
MIDGSPPLHAMTENTDASTDLGVVFSWQVFILLIEWKTTAPVERHRGLVFAHMAPDQNRR